MSEIEYKKDCPNCGNTIFYKRKGDLTYSILNNGFCINCRYKKCENIGELISKGKLGKPRLDMIGDSNPMKNVQTRLLISQKMSGSNNHRFGKENWNSGLGLNKLSDYKKYERKVWNITKRNIPKIKNFDKTKRGRAGVDGAYHVDHIISIRKGFKQKISEEIIGGVLNLQFIPWEENQARRELHKKVK